jgi:hypothetical protein
MKLDRIIEGLFLGPSHSRACVDAGASEADAAVPVAWSGNGGSACSRLTAPTLRLPASLSNCVRRLQ